MKIIDSTVYDGRNIHSHKKCIVLDVDLEGYSEIPSKDIKGFNEKLVKLLPILYTCLLYTSLVDKPLSIIVNFKKLSVNTRSIE